MTFLKCFRYTTLVLLVLLLPTLALAQEDPEDPWDSDAGTTDWTDPSSDTPSMPDRSGGQLSASEIGFRADMGGVVITGRVVSDGGSAPNSPARVVAICGGAVLAEGITNLKGYFTVSSEQRDEQESQQYEGAEASSAALSSGARNGGVRECEVRISLHGYRPETFQVGEGDLRGRINLGNVAIRRVGDTETSTISATSLLAPKNARDAFEHGREAVKKNRWDEARKQLEKAVSLYPKYAAAWSELGNVLEQLDDIGGAQRACRQALLADAKYARPYLQLANLAAVQEKWQEVVDTTANAIRQYPSQYPGAYFLNSLAHYNMSNMGAAEKSIREVLELDTLHQYPRANRLLALILAQKGDLVSAADCLRTYLAVSPKAGDADEVRKQLVALDAGQRP